MCIRDRRNLAAGANPIVMKKGMAKAVEAAVGAIKEQSQKAVSYTHLDVYKRQLMGYSTP